MFTGDKSGDFLFTGLHEVGLASQANAVGRDDGLELRGVRITSPVHCAPPANKPTPLERRTCAPYLDRELQLLAPHLRVILALGGIGWQATLGALRDAGFEIPVPAPKFSHGAEISLRSPNGTELSLLGCYHVSQQNTFTGRLAPDMLEAVLERAKQLGGW